MRIISRSKLGLYTVLACAMMTGQAGAIVSSIKINFDDDTFGNPLTEPDIFLEATRLSDLYSPIGITFIGGGGNDGGAILNQSSNFGVDARSGEYFLAFNTGSALSDGGIPKGPETILFDDAMSAVSIYAAGGSTNDTFLLEAFDGNGVLVDSATATTEGFTQLVVESPVGIRSVRIAETSNEGLWVLDDLEVTLIPEPSVSFLTLLGLLGIARSRSRR